MSAAIDYCDKQIGECEQLIISYPHEEACLLKLIAGWQRTKRQIRVKEAQAKPAEQTA
jgi:hypothetical protein